MDKFTRVAKLAVARSSRYNRGIQKEARSWWGYISGEAKNPRDQNNGYYHGLTGGSGFWKGYGRHMVNNFGTAFGWAPKGLFGYKPKVESMNLPARGLVTDLAEQTAVETGLGYVPGVGLPLAGMSLATGFGQNLVGLARDVGDAKVLTDRTKSMEDYMDSHGSRSSGIRAVGKQIHNQ